MRSGIHSQGNQGSAFHTQGQMVKIICLQSLNKMNHTFSPLLLHFPQCDKCTQKLSAPVTVLSVCLSTRIPSLWEYQDTKSRLWRVFEKTWHLVWERSQEYQIHWYLSESLLMHKQQMFNYGNFQSQVERTENLQGPNTPKCSCNLLALYGIGTWNIGKVSLPCKDWLKKQAWKEIFIVFSTIGRCVHTRKHS